MQARIDENDRKTAQGVSSVDSITPIHIRVDPVTSYVLVDVVSDSITIVGDKHRIDENDMPTCYGVSSIDDVTLIPIRTDSNGKLLTQFT